MQIWLELILRRAFQHDNSRLRRITLHHFLGLNLNPRSPSSTAFPTSGVLSLNVTISVILGPFLDAVNDRATYAGIQGPATGRSIIEFLLRFYDRLGDDKFVSAEFPLSASGVQRLSGPQRQAVFLRRLIGSLFDVMIISFLSSI